VLICWLQAPCAKAAYASTASQTLQQVKHALLLRKSTQRRLSATMKTYAEMRRLTFPCLSSGSLDGPYKPLIKHG
jgi:hypothetical protein